MDFVTSTFVTLPLLMFNVKKRVLIDRVSTYGIRLHKIKVMILS